MLLFLLLVCLTNPANTLLTTFRASGRVNTYLNAMIDAARRHRTGARSLDGATPPKEQK